MNKNSKIYIAGYKGLVGSSLFRHLENEGYENIIVHTHSDLDLINQKAVSDFFQLEKPEYVFLAAAKVGGIMANNTYPAEFIYQNMMIQNNVIHHSYLNGVKRLLFLGSSCIYPKLCPQPMKEEYLLTGPLEPTNSPYAVAKISGIEQCWAYNRQYGTQFIPVMPTNLYGPNDNFDLETSHVLPALLRKFHEAKELGSDFATAWGTGTSLREFLYVDDMVNACAYLMNFSDDVLKDANSTLYNIGTGIDISNKELSEIIADIVGFKGNIVWDTSKPDGPPQKLLDISRMKQIGWQAETSLREGIKKTFEWYKKVC
jgi:GDP-L-fucose synthase